MMDVFTRMGEIFAPETMADVRERTSAVVKKMLSLPEEMVICHSCNAYCEKSKTEFKRYAHPFNHDVMGGHFCMRCLEDDAVQVLIRAAKDKGKHLILGYHGSKKKS